MARRCSQDRKDRVRSYTGPVYTVNVASGGARLSPRSHSNIQPRLRDGYGWFDAGPLDLATVDRIVISCHTLVL